MKLMIASDIHGSEGNCRRMLEIFHEEGAQRLILLGDLLYHGPRNNLPEDYHPKGVIALLNAAREKLLCVRGNCDAEVDQMVLEFPILSDSMLLYLQERAVFVTHGHIFNLQQLPPLCQGDILLHGHTHVQAMREEKGILYLNPGSVSLPKEGNCRSYMLYEDGCFTIYNLETREQVSSVRI